MVNLEIVKDLEAATHILAAFNEADGNLATVGDKNPHDSQIETVIIHEVWTILLYERRKCEKEGVQC